MCNERLACGCNATASETCHCRTVIRQSQRVCFNCQQRQARQLAANAAQLAATPAAAPQDTRIQGAMVAAQQQTAAQPATATATALPHRVQQLKTQPRPAAAPKATPQRKTKAPTSAPRQPTPAPPCQIGGPQACNACENCNWWNNDVAPEAEELLENAPAIAQQFEQTMQAVAQAEQAAAGPQPFVDEHGQLWTPVSYMGALPADEQARRWAEANRNEAEQAALRAEWVRRQRGELTMTAEDEIALWHFMEHIGEVEQGSEEDPIELDEDRMEE